MAVKRKVIKKAGRKVMLMTLFALLFFVVVMTVTGYFNTKYGNSLIPGSIVPVTGTPTPEPPQAVAADIVLVTDDDGALTAAFIAETDCINILWRMDVIPLDTRLELSMSLYKECVLINVQTPQFLTVGELFKYFSGDNAINLTAKAIRELLPFSPDHVVHMKKSTYLKLFRENPETYSYGDFLNTELKTQIRRSGGLYAFVKQIAGELSGGLSADASLFYLETYESLTNLRVSCRLIPGERHSNGYRIMAVSADFYKK